MPHKLIEISKILKKVKKSKKSTCKIFGMWYYIQALARAGESNAL